MSAKTIDFDAAYFSWIPGTQTYEVHYEDPTAFQWQPSTITRDDLEAALAQQDRARSQEVMTTPVRTKAGIWFPPR